MAMPDRNERRPLPRSVNHVLGALLLPVIAVSFVTGIAIWGLGLVNPPSAMQVIFLHGYVGLFSLPVIAAKIVAGVRGWRRSGGSPGLTERVATWGLLVATIALYGSGTMMFTNLTPGGNAGYKLVHLYSAVAATPFLTYHLVRYLGKGLRVARMRLTQQPQASPALNRAQFIQLSSIALIGAWGVNRVPERLGGDLRSSDPNDFPVTLTAGGADQPDPVTWRLEITGDVERPFKASLEDLNRYPTVRETYALDCVIGWSVTREWGGVAVMDLIEDAVPVGELLSARLISTTGYQVALPLHVIEKRGTMVARDVNGVPLTSEHGYPGRLMAPGVIGEECVKWLARIEVVTAS